MKYQIEYACACHKGKVRSNNEDNFWCCGEFLPADNQGADHVRTGNIPRESCLCWLYLMEWGRELRRDGFYLAAQSCGEFYQKNRKMIGEEPEEFLAKLCREMNEAVCRYGDENRIRSMGTTAAVLLFGEEAVFGCNLGDSRIYQVSDGHFRQISTDHTWGGSLFGKAPLTQYVGIPADSMELEPSIIRRRPEQERDI